MASQTFSEVDRRYIRCLFCNPSYTEKMRMYQLSWYFDHRARHLSPLQAYQAVLETMQEMQKPQGEYKQ